MFLLRTDLGRFQGGAEGAFVVFFGRPEGDPGVPEERRLILEDFGAGAVEALADVTPQACREGLVMVLPPRLKAEEAVVAREVQRYLAYMYAKHVDFPRQSQNIPDQYGVRDDPPVQVFLKEINRAKNLPQLLRWPLAEKVERLELGLPCILLLPGPSLASILPALPELAAKCLVVAISRTFPACVQAGVEPDFMLQLDTHFLHRHKFPPHRRFDNSYLMALPSSAVFGLTERFRGAFFLDSFDPASLPNPHRVRESWLSTMLAAMGLAEVLKSPEVYMAGADLSYPVGGGRYVDSVSPDGASPPEPFPLERPLLVGREAFVAPDLAGRAVQTTLPYFAVAAEADYFAQDIHKATGARFFNLSRTGLLNPERFPPCGFQQVLAGPDIDRMALQKAVDTASREPERIRFGVLVKRLTQQLEVAEGNLAQLKSARHRGLWGELLKTPLMRALTYFREYNAGVADPVQKVLLAEALQEQLARALAAGLAEAKLAKAAAQGEPVDGLCLAGEGRQALKLAGKRLPGLRLVPHGVWPETVPPPAPEEGCGPWVAYRDLMAWILARPVVALTPEAAREFDYVLEALPRHAWLVL